MTQKARFTAREVALLARDEASFFADVFVDLTRKRSTRSQAIARVESRLPRAFSLPTDFKSARSLPRSPLGLKRRAAGRPLSRLRLESFWSALKSTRLDEDASEKPSFASN